MKFRVWNIINKRYESSNDYAITKYGFLNEILDGILQLCNQYDYKIEYSTGLLDKNKIEIYQGDILKFENKDPDGCDQISVSTIGFDLGPLQLLHAEKWEIIGNINENAHLTEKK